MSSWPEKIEARSLSADFCTRNFWDGGGVSRVAATPLIVALSPGHSDITRFRPWSPIATGNHLDRAEKIPKIAQTTGTVDVLDPRSGISGPTSRRVFTCLNLHEWWTQPAHVKNQCKFRLAKIWTCSCSALLSRRICLCNAAVTQFARLMWCFGSYWKFTHKHTHTHKINYFQRL